jgi:integrase
MRLDPIARRVVRIVDGMPSGRTGSLERYRHADGRSYYRARIRLGDGSRTRIDVPDQYAVAAGGKSAEERAELYVRAAQEREDERGELLAKKRGRDASTHAKTIDAFAESVFQGRQAEGKSSVGRERRMWKARVSPRLGHLDIATVSKDQIEDFRDYLDAEVRKRIAGTRRDGISGKTAMILWTLVRTVLKEAVNCRDRTKRVRGDDPTAGVLPPLKTRSPKKTFIFPSEFEALLACPQVPREWRELYAIGAYLYLRPGELRALTFEHVDLDAGIVSVVMAYDEEAGQTKTTKTEKGQREVPIPRPLLPLLSSMRERAERTDFVAPLLGKVADNKRAALLRDHLKLAGVDRLRLLEDTATTMRVNFRSLRDSGITWEALAGTPIDRIQSRAGHEHIATTLGYVKAVEDLTGKFGTPFGPLSFGAIRPGIGPSDMAESKSIVTSSSYKLRLLDSNQRPGG